MIEEANSPMDFHDSLNGAMIALALFITNSSVAASDVLIQGGAQYTIVSYSSLEEYTK